ncbi:unnamed protein product [Spirodela intermedia]|uniref:Protein-ribulosamine 3-kinase, chloroplastic n=1 Tax=Spirodela intermedia TaxID=51605 RepID=A0ABN7EAV0_SPIIN|nr:unnamed protein product [Spirodela intermedia]
MKICLYKHDFTLRKILKWSSSHHLRTFKYDSKVFSTSIGPSMFEGEALGLNAMYATKTIRVPQPFKVGALPTGGSFIIMEYIEFGLLGRPGSFCCLQLDSVLGKKLAEMHKAGKSDKGFGFDVDNTIGSSSEHRLGYQLNLALKQYGDSSIYEKDLWSGNISSDKTGETVILDPACFYGHNEAEFGMSWCAGFGGSFYSSYFEVMPKQQGFEKRRDLYMLYHYLNHYNLFGSGYRSSAMSIIDDYLRILKA